MQFSTIRPESADIKLLTELYHECRRAADMEIVPDYFLALPDYVFSENFHDQNIPEDCGELHQIYLLPAYQGKGFGKKLYKELQQDFRELGHSSFIACTYLENEGAKAFYKAIGASHLKDDVLGAPWHRPVTFYIDKV